MAKKKEDGETKEYSLSIREQKFVAYYIEYGDAQRAVKEAGFNTTSPLAYSRKLLAKNKIQKELQEQMALLKNDCIASANEIMVFYTNAMRGEVKDQFGIEASLADRMKAAEALAKRQIDMKAIADKAKENEITVNVVWDRNNTKVEPDIPVNDDDDDLFGEDEE